MATVVQEFTITQVVEDAMIIVGGEPSQNASIQPRGILRAMENFTVAAILTGSDEVISIVLDLPTAFAYRFVSASFLFAGTDDDGVTLTELNDAALYQLSNSRSPGFPVAEAYPFSAGMPGGLSDAANLMAVRTNGTVFEGVKSYNVGNNGNRVPLGILQSRTTKSGGLTPGQIKNTFTFFKPAASGAVGAGQVNCFLQFLTYDIEQVRYSTSWALPWS